MTWRSAGTLELPVYSRKVSLAGDVVFWRAADPTAEVMSPTAMA